MRPGVAPGSCHILSYGADRPYRLSLLAGTAAFMDAEAQQLTAIPSRIVLDQNSPNPFNATTRIRFGLPATARVTLEIYNVRGERVATLLQDEQRPAGYHSVVWNGTNHAGRLVASGVYLCRMRAGAAALTRRLVLLE